MYFSAKRLLAVIIFIFVLSVVSQAQCPVMPSGFVCLSQQAANVAAENARELAATKDKVAIVEAGMIEKDKILADTKAEDLKSINDLKAALTKTQTNLGTATGQLIGAEAMNVRLTAIVDVLLKNTRAKCLPFSVCIGR